MVIVILRSLWAWMEFTQLMFTITKWQSKREAENIAATLNWRVTRELYIINKYINKYITFDRGNNWRTLRAPEVDSQGNEINCSGDCSLQLRGRTTSEKNAIYSSESAVGLAIGIGNTGFYLSEDLYNMNTYITRNGGMDWIEVYSLF